MEMVPGEAKPERREGIGHYREEWKDCLQVTEDELKGNGKPEREASESR